MKRPIILSFVLVVGLFLIYLGLRELLWVVRDSSSIDDNLAVVVEIDPTMTGWLDPLVDKEITVTNRLTQSTLHIDATSIEWNLYFFVVKDDKNEFLIVADEYLGSNVYSYATLELLSNIDCLGPENSCDGLSEQELSALGQATLIFDSEGFKK
jgi:hypothetical protein